jgi:acetyl esterase/lipase
MPARLFYPSSATGDKPKTKGVVLHIHGGGWVLMSHLTADPLLQAYADNSNCAVVSLGYRLAPEDPFPAGPEDCYEAAGYLADHAEEEYGGPLMFIGGEVCGGFLFSCCFHAVFMLFSCCFHAAS